MYIEIDMDMGHGYFNQDIIKVELSGHLHSFTTVPPSTCELYHQTGFSANRLPPPVP